jgi:hypothetical protein
MHILNAGVVFSMALITAFLLSCVIARPNATSDRIRVVPNESERRVDFLIDSQPFSSSMWTATPAKPVLYPLRTASGVIVTRGYPRELRPGEKVQFLYQVLISSDIATTESTEAASRGPLPTIARTRLGVR